MTVAPARARTIKTMCPMNCNPTHCGMIVTVEDGRVSIAGDRDNPDSRGFLCVRGRAAHEILDNPRRLERPLRRVGPRGSDAWEPITWDDALDEIALAIRRAGRERVGVWPGHGMVVNGISAQLVRRFGYLGGFQFWNPAIVCWALGAYGLQLTGLLQANTKEDLAANSRTVLFWGANLASQPSTAPHLVAARKRGATVIGIDCRRTELGPQTDHFVLVRPGTDAALALGTMRAILDEGLHDRASLDAHTVGFERLAESLRRYTLEWAAVTTGLDAESDAVAEGLERVGLIVAHDLFSNATIRRYADIVLSGTSWLEEVGVKETATHVYLMDQALPPSADTRPISRVLADLAARLDLPNAFPWSSQRQAVDALLAGLDEGQLDVERLRREDGRYEKAISHVAYPHHRYDTPSGKVELYSERAAALGLPPLPVYEPPAETPESAPELARRYPLVFRQGRSLTSFHGFYDEARALPSLARINPGPELWISPADAEDRAIRDGDPIELFNDRGRAQAHARVTADVPPGLVWMRDGWVAVNVLTSNDPCLPPDASEALPIPGGQATYEALIEVRRLAEPPNTTASTT
jgi:anaerobic selenocysteine-containing dehydrogenase